MERRISVVAIGRNEGQRLKRCLESVKTQTPNIVYVDSGSTDESVVMAESMGVSVCQLDMSIPFSAARARNEGFKIALSQDPDITHVQFIDGDCILEKEWLSTAADFLNSNQEYAAAAGRRSEIHPESSIYNLLCDIEWNTPVGDADACGGDFMIRVDAFSDVQGFNPSVIAGEEPDLCYRLRRKNWKIRRIDAPMTRHDANMTTFHQWWKRAVRAGHAYVHGYWIHRKDKSGYNRRAVAKDWVWALLFPLFTIVAGTVISYWFFCFFIVYPVRYVRILINKQKDLQNFKKSFIYSIFIVLSSVPQLIGQIIFFRRIIQRKNMQIIEHK